MRPIGMVSQDLWASFRMAAASIYQGCMQAIKLARAISRAKGNVLVSQEAQGIAHHTP